MTTEARQVEDTFDTVTNSWAEAERLHPGSSAAWDRDGGPLWALGYPALTICVSETTLAVGCNDRVPFRWALWLPDAERWLFLPDRSAFDYVDVSDESAINDVRLMREIGVAL